MGFAIAAPVGPIGVLVIRRSLAEGRASGLASGLGAATADAAYGALAGFGLTVVTAFLVEGQGWLRLVGGAFLCYLGVRTLLARPAEEATDVREKGGGLVGAYASTFLLTLTNPTTILSFAAVFAGMGGHYRRPRLDGPLGAGRFPRFGLVVAAAERRRGPLQWQDRPARHEGGEPPLRHADLRVRRLRRLERGPVGGREPADVLSSQGGIMAVVRGPVYQDVRYTA